MTSLLSVAHSAGVALGPEGEIGVVASSSSSNSNSNSSSSSNNSSNSISDSRAALVVAVDPEVDVALGGAARLQGKSFAMAVLGLGILLSTAQRLQLL